MNPAKIQAAIHACIAISNSIEAIIEDERLCADTFNDIPFELGEAFNHLTGQLSIELGVDAKKLVRDLISSEMESSRALLRAMEV